MCKERNINYKKIIFLTSINVNILKFVNETKKIEKITLWSNASSNIYFEEKLL